MKKIIILFLFLPFCVFAQENTFSKKTDQEKMLRDSTAEPQTSAMVITFDPKLYMSQIDKQLGVRNNLTFDQLVDKMRYDLAESVAFRLGDKMPAHSLFQPRSDSLMRELHFTYTSVQYAYRPLIANDQVQSDPDKNSAKVKINRIQVKKNTENKSRNEREPGTRIENGQIVSEEDTREKFMDCEIINPELLHELHKIYNSSYFIFINQLDLMYSPESIEFIRVKVHYSCFNLQGKKIHSGAAVKNMPADITNLKVIRNDYFYPIAIEIAEKLDFAIKTFLVRQGN